MWRGVLRGPPFEAVYGIIATSYQDAAVLQQGGGVPKSRHHHVAGGDKGLGVRVHGWQSKQHQKQEERTPGNVDHDSPLKYRYDATLFNSS
jgi:hypothetical protein